MTSLTSLNSLENCLVTGDYALGWSLYQELQQPTAKEDQLGGRCLWGLGRYEEAKIPLYKAAQKGESGSVIDIVNIHMQLNEFAEAKDWLDASTKLPLTPQDRIRSLIVQGEMHMKQFQIRQTIKILKNAWVQANLLEDAPNLVAQVANSLTWALHVSGQYQGALIYVSKALPKISGAWEVILIHTRAEVSIFYGDLEQAKNDLHDMQREARENLLFETNQYFLNGIYDIAKGNIPQAIQNFDSAHQLAQQTENKTFIVQACSYLSAANLALNNLGKARAALMPLSNLELSPAEEATRHLRLGQLHAVSQDFEQARISLESAVAAFSTLEHQRELSWSLLRLAHLHLERGDQKLANQTLERVSDIANSVGGTAFLVPELNLIGIETLKRLGEIATPYAMHVLMPVLEPDRTVTIPLESRPVVRRLRIVTLGKPALLAEDRHVTPRLNKAMELIAYLCLHPQSSLERILDNVFPDSDLKAGANYFHQLRHRITKDVPELRVVQDKQTKAYTLDSGTVPLECDYEDVVKLLNHPTQNELHQALEIYRGAFMPHLESEWAEEVRNNVEWLLVRSGLRVVQDLYERGDFEDCRKLTERLRKVAPLDEGLNELLVRATNEIDGLLAARRTLSDVEKYFRHEVGELPPALENLKQEIKLNLN